MKNITCYLFINRQNRIKVGKTRYRLNDGEMRIKISVNIPDKFYSVPQIEKVCEITIPESALPNIEPKIKTTIV